MRSTARVASLLLALVLLAPITTLAQPATAPTAPVDLRSILITAASAVLVALIGAFFGKQALDAKDATIALLERTVKAKDDEKAAALLGLQQQIKYYELVAPTKLVDEMDALRQLAEERAEELKRQKEASERREAELQAELAQAKADGEQAVARAKEEALRQLRAERSVLGSKVGQLQGVAAASGTVAGFLRAAGVQILGQGGQGVVLRIPREAWDGELRPAASGDSEDTAPDEDATP